MTLMACSNKVTTNYNALNFLTVRKIPGMNTCQFKGLNYHPITDENEEKCGKYLYQRNKNFYKTKAVNDETIQQASYSKQTDGGDEAYQLTPSQQLQA